MLCCRPPKKGGRKCKGDHCILTPSISLLLATTWQLMKQRDEAAIAMVISDWGVRLVDAKAREAAIKSCVLVRLIVD